MTFSFDGELITVPDQPHESLKDAPLVSIILTAYKRPEQLRYTLETIRRQNYHNRQVIVVEDGSDGGVTKEVAVSLGADYLFRKNRPDKPYSNVAVPMNIGIRAARGEVLVLQCAECAYEDDGALRRLVEPVINDTSVSTCASTRVLNKDGSLRGWYSSPETHPHCFLPFSQAVATKHILALGGIDENYVDYGLEDNDFEFRLQFSGVRCVYADVTVTHQWHEEGARDESRRAAAFSYYQAKLSGLKRGEPLLVANVGKDWGCLDS